MLVFRGVSIQILQKSAEKYPQGFRVEGTNPGSPVDHSEGASSFRMIHGLQGFPTVDGSEIPDPTTVWMVRKPGK